MPPPLCVVAPRCAEPTSAAYFSSAPESDGRFGITGFLLAGDRDGAQDVWGLINGQTIITQDILQGKQEFNFVETYPAPAVLPMEQ